MEIDERRSVGGKLYVCGRTFLRGRGPCHPVETGATDGAGHTPFPRPLVASARRFEKSFQNARFVEVRGEYFAFAALEVSSISSSSVGRTNCVKQSQHCGRLWAWGVGMGVTPCLGLAEDELVCSFDVGGNTLYAATVSGALYCGSYAKDTTHSDGVALVPFTPPPLGRVIAVAASEDNVAIICHTDSGSASDCGSNVARNGLRDVYTFGRGVATGFVEELHGGATWRKLNLINRDGEHVNAKSISMGSLNGGAVGEDGSGFVWGDGMSGSLGCGRRLTQSPEGVPIHVALPNEHIEGLTCTKAQSNPKRVFVRRGGKEGGTVVFESGQEGPRCHLITKKGSLWLCGTSHKGLAANCVSKALSPSVDCLAWYRVGGEAIDLPTTDSHTTDRAKANASLCNLKVLPTGAFEMAMRCRNTCSSVHKASCESERSADFTIFAKQLGVSSLLDIGRDGRTNYFTEQGLHVVQTSVAHIHSASLASDGRCFLWGCGSDGRLGLKCFFDPKGSKRLLKCYVSSPTAVETFLDRGMRVLSVSVFRCSTCFIVEEKGAVN